MVDSADPDVEARLRDEERFHDERFEDGAGERSAARFYAITQRSIDAFHGKLDAIPPGSHVLELGCGLHCMAWRMLERGVKVTAIDISQVAVDLSIERAAELGFADATFLKMNAEDLEFDDDTFDVVVGSSIVHHLDIPTAMSEIARCLRPGGRFLFNEPTGHNPLINAYRRLTPSQRTADEHPLRREDLAAIEAAADEVDLDFYHLLSLLAIPLSSRPVFGSVLGRLDRADAWLFRQAPRLRPYGWMVVIDGRVGEPTGP